MNNCNFSDEDSDVELDDYLTNDKRRVLEFMQIAPQNELQLMASCSKKKAEAIIAARPFKGWIDLVTKLQTNKNLSTDLLNAAQRVLVTRNNIKQLMKKCYNISQQLQIAINNGVTVKKPKILTTTYVNYFFFFAKKNCNQTKKNFLQVNLD